MPRKGIPIWTQSHRVAFLLGLALVLVKGVMATGPGRHVDTRYFFAAGKCLLGGESPYDLAAFRMCWQEALSIPFRSAYLFPPVSFLYAVTLAPFSWAEARVLADCFGVLSFGFLAAALMRLVKPSLRTRNEALASSAWLLFALTGSGVLGSIFVGQGSVMVSAAVAWVLVGMRESRAWPFALGTVFATVKPQISLVAVLLGWLCRPKQLQRLKIGVATTLILGAALGLVVYGDTLSDYRESLAHHSSSRFTGLAPGDRLYGLPDLLSSASGIELRGLLVVPVWFVAMWLILNRWKPQRGPIDQPEVIAFVVLLGAFLFPIKGYDFAVFAIVFAMIGTMRFRLQAILAVPMILLWRPALADRLLALLGQFESLSSIALVNTVILLVLATLAARLLWPVVSGRHAARESAWHEGVGTVARNEPGNDA